MSIVKTAIVAVPLVTAAAGGYGDDGVVGAGAAVQCALDLSEKFVVTSFSPMDVPYSAVGWGIEENGADGWSVTLELTPVGEVVSSVVASGLAGRGTNSWDTGNLRNGDYVLRHSVRKNGVEEPIETLEAHLVFDRSAARPLETLAEVADAVFPDAGRPCAVTAMGGVNWTAVGLAGDGIAGPASGTATLTFEADGIGTFAFEYLCAAGETLTVAVDDGEPQTLAAAEGWTEARFAFGDACAHAVVVSAAGAGTAVRGVRWDDGSASDGRVGVGAVDLREGVLVVRRERELMPFAWSSTNFTGNAFEKDAGFVSIDPQSVASVRVVQVTGAGDDVSQWATEVAGTSKTLVSERQGEDAVKWKGAKPGVWKAELVLEAGGSETYRETRILDLRKYTGQGLVILVK